jgi:hypothetical protein
VYRVDRFFYALRDSLVRVVARNVLSTGVAGSYGARLRVGGISTDPDVVEAWRVTACCSVTPVLTGGISITRPLLVPRLVVLCTARRVVRYWLLS